MPTTTTSNNTSEPWKRNGTSIFTTIWAVRSMIHDHPTPRLQKNKRRRRTWPPPPSPSPSPYPFPPFPLSPFPPLPLSRFPPSPLSTFPPLHLSPFPLFPLSPSPPFPPSPAPPRIRPSSFSSATHPYPTFIPFSLVPAGTTKSRASTSRPSAWSTPWPPCVRRRYHVGVDCSIKHSRTRLNA